MDELKPKDHGETVALFRCEIVGHLSRRDLDRGELRAELRRLSQKRFRPPKSKRTRTYAVSTLERWYYRYKCGGLEALRPSARSDRGRAQQLTEQQRTLLCDIRREHRSASVPLILRTLVAEGRLTAGAVSAATVRRLYQDAGLTRRAMADSDGDRIRLRWQAERPRALWHADVCHGPSLCVGDRKLPVRIHAIVDDASRYVVALLALSTEREVDMLHLFVRALRRHGAPDALYLDNGSTYRGDVLRLGCERLGITLLHAAPYDPQARGKMERLWRTLREQALRYMGQLSSLHDVNVRLWAWLDTHYHRAPHAALFGRTPADRWADADDDLVDRLDEAQIRRALTVRERRRVRRDNTLSVAGLTFQLDQGFLAGRVVTVAYCMIDDPPAPVVEHDDRLFALQPVDPVKNATVKRRSRPGASDDATKPSSDVEFNPAETNLRLATGRLRPEKPEEVDG